ncbi:hypothetical protein HanXRQr2_Chr12g0563571 [Helianthus annuus]|uniref:Uncharacterized protein n=1 Tax=Helianthus annuus TaxID=4232 RepID=A0A9K3HK73_HELAN|nr:hypothetical protein HanXRQr2_Chr12g0563571 [Helianthus annuus]
MRECNKTIHISKFISCISSVVVSHCLFVCEMCVSFHFVKDSIDVIISKFISWWSYY